MKSVSVKEHYDSHLGKFYSWIAGDVKLEAEHFSEMLRSMGIFSKGETALDLGSGHGIHSIALKKNGYNVHAVDFNKQLLKELKDNEMADQIFTYEADIRNVKTFNALGPTVITCCGDTITHLSSVKEIQKFLLDSIDILDSNGKLILSFRDYSKGKLGTYDVIPVKSTNDKIATCVLNYTSDRVQVMDLLYENTGNDWKLCSSAYDKVVIDPDELVEFLNTNNMSIEHYSEYKGFKLIIANKPR